MGNYNVGEVYIDLHKELCLILHVNIQFGYIYFLYYDDYLISKFVWADRNLTRVR